MPLPGIYASQISGHLFSPSGAYDSLASVTLSATTASVIFAGIPSGYKHLQIRFISRTTVASTGFDDTLVQFNGDTGANYAFHRLMGDGSTVTAVGLTGYPNIYISGSSVRGNSMSNAYGATILDILDYSSSVKNKVTRALDGVDINGSGEIHLMSGLWLSTSPITSITLTAESSHSFAQYSTFALYGVK